MQMMDQSGQGSGQNYADKQTLEINPAHPIVVNLNHLRKNDPTLASLVSHQMLDNVLLASNIPLDSTKAQSRAYSLIDKILDAELGDEQAPRAQRKLKPVSKHAEEDAAETIESKDQEMKIEFETNEEHEQDGEGALKRSQRDVKGKGSNTKISTGFTVSDEHLTK